MTNNSEDRRARRSRRLLKQGLLELLREKRFSEISVRDITDRMDMNRGTFYLHYADTYDLLQNVEEDILRNVQMMIDEHREETSAGTLKPIFEPILHYIVENRTACYSLFVNNANSNFVGRVNELIYRNGSDLVRQRYPSLPEEQMEYLLGFVSYGLIGLIRQWFETDMRLPAGQIVQMADRLVNGAAGQLSAPAAPLAEREAPPGQA
jgi:AcrR family transcriptional regulator